MIHERNLAPTLRDRSGAAPVYTEDTRTPLPARLPALGNLWGLEGTTDVNQTANIVGGGPDEDGVDQMLLIIRSNSHLRAIRGIRQLAKFT